MKIWRYDLPNVDRCGWAIVVICEDGYFSAVTDYGNYAYKWSSFGDCFRTFLVGLENGQRYISGKISRKEYNGEATCKDIKECILEMRRNGSFTEEEARKEWQLIAENNGLETEVDFTRFYDSTEIDDVNELYGESYNNDAIAFVKEILPRLVKTIRTELESEKTVQDDEK